MGISLDRAARPSSFADWVFCYTRDGRMPTWQRETPDLVDHARNEICRLGVLDHSEIERIRRHIATHMAGNGLDYGVWFADNNETKDKRFEMPSLQIGGRPLHGRPDLVLRNSRNGHIIIVERKTTRQQRVIDQFQERRNWRNIEAQLWCYSHIKEWADDQNVTLIGEFWRNHLSALIPVLEPFIWRKDCTDHDNRCRALFGHYCTWVSR
jgi:hypothetical protein